MKEESTDISYSCTTYKIPVMQFRGSSTIIDVTN